MQHRQVLSVMMIDVKNSSQLWVSDPRWMAAALDGLYAFIKSAAAKDRGVLVKCIGDAFMLAFKEPEDAIRMAVRLQTALRRRRSRIGVRIGIAHGPMYVRNWEVQHCRLLDYFGNTVNTAARVESLVSTVGGLAVAICTRSKTQRDRVLSALVPGQLLPRTAAMADVVHFSSSMTACSAGLRRSLRLVPYSVQRQRQECRSVRDLHGVSPVEVFLVRSV